MDCLGRRIVSIAAIVLLIAFSFLACDNSADTLPYYNSAEFDPIFIANEEDARQKITHRISDFALVNQNRHTITQSDVDGKVHVANFIFTSCGSICPKMTNHMKMVSDEFDDDGSVVLLSFSVTPWIDDVPRLKQYAKDNDIVAANWHLLTGNKAEIYDLARRSYFAEQSLGFTKDSTDFLHTEHFLLVDQHRRIRGIYNGTLKLEMKQLIEDVRQLLDEAD